MIAIHAAPKSAASIVVVPRAPVAVETSEEIPSVPITTAATRGPKGDTGAQGPPGPAGSATISAIAGETLSGERVVTTQADGTLIYHDPTQLSFASAVAFITLTAAIGGGDIDVVSYGSVSASYWSWTPGDPIFLGPNGTLTQTVPSLPDAVFLLQVAVAETSTTIFWDPQPSIVLA